MSDLPEVKVKLSGESGREVSFRIIGMHCASCSLTVQKAIRSVRGVLSVDVSAASNEARVSVGDGFDRSELLKAVQAVGYDIYREDAVISLKHLEADNARLIESAASKIDGVFKVRINPGLNQALVTYNPLEVEPRELAEELRGMGLDVVAVSSYDEADIDEKAALIDLNDIRIRLIIALPLTAALFVAASLNYLGLLGNEQYNLIGLILATPIQFYSGWRFMRGAAFALRHGAANMDVLVTLGSLSAYLLSVYLLARSLASATFFDSSAIITFILIGKYVEAKMKWKARESIGKLGSSRLTARLVDGREVPVADVEPGDKVMVAAGETVPVDGVVDQGEGLIDESAISGESTPVRRGIGDAVIGGSRLLNGYLVIRATRTGKYSFMSQIRKLVRQAQSSRLPIQSLIDKVSGYFSWTVISIAVITLITWLFAMQAPPPIAIIYMASVLVVACPCALGLATPLSIMVSMGRSASLGILIRNAEALERMPRVKVMVLDKTGTLTTGKPAVSYVYDARGGVDVIKWAASAETASNHPIAAAIIAEARRLGLEIRRPASVDVVDGGIVADIDGNTVAVGNEAVVKGMGLELPPSVEAIAKGRPGTLVYVVLNDELLGFIELRDSVRPEARELIDWLKRNGIKPIIVTGDSEGPARSVASELGIEEFYSGVMPAEKGDLVHELRRSLSSGFLAMVGDGTNDAPALGMADVGIAMGGGTDIAKEAGDVILVRNDLRQVIRLHDIARKTMSNIRFNIAYAFIYNAALIPLAAGVFGIMIRPEFASIAMAMSSISVTLNSLRLMRA